MLKMINALLLMSTFACVSNYYEGYRFEIPEFVYLFVFIGVLGVSVVWSIFHVIGGSIFGLAGGDVSDGMKMGLILGLGDGMGRLWPYCLAWALAAFFFATDESWHTYAAIALAAFFFVLTKLMNYIWNRVEQ